MRTKSIWYTQLYMQQTGLGSRNSTGSSLFYSVGTMSVDRTSSKPIYTKYMTICTVHHRFAEVEMVFPLSTFAFVDNMSESRPASDSISYSATVGIWPARVFECPYSSFFVFVFSSSLYSFPWYGIYASIKFVEGHTICLWLYYYYIYKKKKRVSCRWLESIIYD